MTETELIAKITQGGAIAPLVMMVVAEIKSNNLASGKWLVMWNLALSAILNFGLQLALRETNGSPVMWYTTSLMAVGTFAVSWLGHSRIANAES